MHNIFVWIKAFGINFHYFPINFFGGSGDKDASLLRLEGTRRCFATKKGKFTICRKPPTVDTSNILLRTSEMSS